jgi:hypothetical protein
LYKTAFGGDDWQMRDDVLEIGHDFSAVVGDVLLRAQQLRDSTDTPASAWLRDIETVASRVVPAKH